MSDQMIRTGTIPGTPGGPAYRGKSRKPAPPVKRPLDLSKVQPQRKRK
jgi:hypothetical protein